MSSTNAIRQNYHADSEAAINKQINLELTASYTYQAMAFYFDRHDVALAGFSKRFRDNSKEEREHAETLMSYQNERGGRVAYGDITAPKTEWGNGLEALQAALELEKQVNQALLDLHAVSRATNDAHLSDFLESKFLNEQVEAIKKLGDLITKLKRAGPTGLGEYLFDKDLSS
jgi:ferritin heavy chain